jgi:hypothetical protein
MIAVQDAAEVQYADIANAVIRRFSVIIGSERAVRVAATVPGLALDPTTQAVCDASQDGLDRLIREYQSIGGTVALLLMKRTVAPLVKDSLLALPGSLR